MLYFFGVIGGHHTQCNFSFTVWGMFKKGNAPGVGGMGVAKTFSFFLMPLPLPLNFFNFSSDNYWVAQKKIQKK